MVDRPANLPDYERPPIVEMVLGVQFAELPGFKTVHAGLLWEEKFRAAYPRFDEQAPLEPSFEVFGSQQRLKFEIKQVPGLPPRLWFMNEKDDELVQISFVTCRNSGRFSTTGQSAPSNRTSARLHM